MRKHNGSNKKWIKTYVTLVGTYVPVEKDCLVQCTKHSIGRGKRKTTQKKTTETFMWIDNENWLKAIN